MSLLTTIMKWAAIAALCLAVFFGPTEANGLLLRLVVAVSAIFVALEALFAHRYVQAIAFVAIAAVFNPIIPITSSRLTGIGLDLGVAAIFVAALTFLRVQEIPVLSMPSITDRTPGSLSL